MVRDQPLMCPVIQFEHPCEYLPNTRQPETNRPALVTRIAVAKSPSLQQPYKSSVTPVATRTVALSVSPWSLEAMSPFSAGADRSVNLDTLHFWLARVASLNTALNSDRKSTRPNSSHRCNSYA